MRDGAPLYVRPDAIAAMRPVFDRSSPDAESAYLWIIHGVTAHHVRETVQQILNMIDPRVADVATTRAFGALDVAFQYGQIDGDHHKAWVIDQMVREITGDAYSDWIAAAVSDGHTWDAGVPP